LLSGRHGRDDGEDVDGNPAATAAAALAARLRGVASAGAAAATSATSSTSAAAGIDAEGLRRRAEAAAAAATEASEKQREEDEGKLYAPWAMRRLLFTKESVGRINTLAVDATNEWFVSGGSDGAIRAWDIATGKPRVTFDTRHVEPVRSVAISTRSPYLFSAGDDRVVRCFDLERSLVIREYFGHLRRVNCVAAHANHDVIVTCGDDATVRVWDVRTREAVQVLTGANAHASNVMSLTVQEATPQIVSGDADGMIFLWDLGMQRPITRLTRHKKAVRALVLHPHETTLISAGADKVRKWRMPTGEYMRSIEGVTDDTSAFARILTCAAKSPSEDVVCIGAQDGWLSWVDWQTGRVLHRARTRDVPGTPEGNGGVLSCAYDRSGRFLLTGEGDYSIKFWTQVTPAAQTA
jgi:pleiotropic regulator 1